MTAESMSTEIIVVETLDRHGRVLFRERIALDAASRRFTVGRSVAADIALDDTHAAPLHVAIDVAPDGRLGATDLGSVNGIVVDGRRHREARDLHLADATFQVGVTRLRIRTVHDALAPEVPERKPLESLVRHPAWLAAGAAAIVAADVAYGAWLGAPQDLTESLVTVLALTAAVTVLWTAVWALLSRVMLGEWRWFIHAAITLATAIAYSVLDGLLNVGRFALARPGWESQTAWLMGLTMAGGLYLHLTQSSSLARRRAAIAAVLAPALLVGGGTWFTERSAARDVNRQVASTPLYPPAFRLAGAESLDTYVASLSDLRRAADEKRRKAIADDPEGSGDEN